jgi:dolichol-phosphate hexosyltransferase
VKLSILMPAFNEQDRIGRALKEALAVEYPVDFEVIVVDDGSTDGTPALLDACADPRVRVLRHERNRGKGAAVRTAAEHASGTHMTVLDADLEYDPCNIPALVQPVLEGRADVVFGNRNFMAHSAYSFWYVIGNRGITLAANLLFNAYVGDLETGLKLMPVDLFRSLAIRSTGFGIEAEMAGKLLRRGVRPYEIPIDYQARTRAEGKKITWRDGVGALGILCRERVRRQPGRAATVGRHPA